MVQKENTNCLVQQKRRLRILLVDDDREDSLIFSRLICHLRKYGVDFTWTSDFENARELIQNHRFHIHFVDYKLGHRSGLDLVADALHADPAKAFVVVTGNGSESVAARAIRAGALDYIAKSDLNEEELATCIERCLQEYGERTRKLKLLENASMDGVTGVYRRDAFQLTAEQRIRVAGPNAQWSLLFLDVDHFKRINDHFGHSEGDQTLRNVADAIRSCLRKSDLVGRYGGDEFCVLTPDCEAEAALALAERIRSVVRSKAGVTVSIGVAAERGPGCAYTSLVRKADEVMYRAKKMGRNRAECWLG